jgi:hypothetical protein
MLSAIACCDRGRNDCNTDLTSFIARSEANTVYPSSMTISSESGMKMK